MKKVFSTIGRPSLLAVFFLLGGLLLTANRAEAQSYNWMTESQALSTLEAEIDQLAIDITNFTPGSTPYKAMANKIHYYKLIHGSVQTGMAVPQAVEVNLGKVNDQFDTTAAMLSKNALVQLYNDAVILLTF